MTTPDTLVMALRDAALAMTTRQSLRDLDHVLDQIVRAAVETVPGAEAGGISITEGDEVTGRSPSHPTIAKLDQLQSELRQGPCISALLDPPPDGVILARDMAGADADRWPQFAPHAVDAGYHSLLSTHLATNGYVRAALNLYATEPDAYDTDAQQTAGLFGIQAAVLLYGSEQAGKLQRAVDSRDMIGQAKGVLMERFTVDADDAFQMLVRSSQDTNMKLIDVAHWLAHEANERARPKPLDLPGDRPRPCP